MKFTLNFEFHEFAGAGNFLPEPEIFWPEPEVKKPRSLHSTSRIYNSEGEEGRKKVGKEGKHAYFP